MADERPPGLEALQAATLQLIGAARQVLDAAEQLVRDPEAVTQVAQSMAAIARAAVQAVTPGGAGSPPAGHPEDEPLEHIDLA
jgi:hypothetical protein